MKQLILLIFLAALNFHSKAQQPQKDSLQHNEPAKKLIRVEAACGICQFEMPGKDCKLAVRINNKPYYVEGTGIDDHGDAHAKDGFCNAIRHAMVRGEIKDSVFATTYFKLIANKQK